MYAVRKGRQCGIFETWEEVKKSVDGFSGAEYKKVKTQEEAKTYINGGVIKSKYLYACKDTMSIYTSWEECKEVVEGISGASYKKFKSREEALDWLNGLENAQNGILNKSIPTVYIDGSHRDGAIGFGVILIAGGSETSFTGKTDGDMGNISGELSALMFTLHILKKFNITKANIVYDYEGIYKWISGDFKAKTQETKEYRDFVKEFVKTNKLQLFYYKCKSHSGTEYNNKADKTAKQALIDGKFYARESLMSMDLEI